MGDTTGSSVCALCPAGTYSGAGAQACTPCPSGTNSDAGAQACSPGPLTSEVIVGPLPLVLTAYQHVSDSDGTTTIAGGETWLAFHESGAAFLVVATDDDGLSYEGTFSEVNGIVTLSFAAPDFTRDAVFAFDPSATQVMLPFKAFDGLPGSSTWKRAEEAELLPLLFDLFFQGATYAREADPVSAIDFAAVQADALVGTDGKGALSEPVIDRVERLPNGVTIYYRDPPPGIDPRLPLKVILFSNVRFNGAELELSPLANDPRVHTNLPSPKKSVDDPPSPTAVFIAPFYSASATVTRGVDAILIMRPAIPGGRLARCEG